MKLYDTPPAEYAFAYRNQPISGNLTNGLGIAEKVRAKYVFHCMEHGPFPWFGLNLFFAMNASLGIVLEQLKYRWYARRSAGPTAKRKVAVDDPAAMAEHIKAKAKEFGAGVVGVAVITDVAQFDRADIPYKFAVSIGCPMRREEMVHVPHARAGREVIRTYGDVGRGAARRIHSRDGLASLCHRLAVIERPAADPARHQCRHRTTRQTRIVDLRGVWLQLPPVVGGDRPTDGGRRTP